MYAKTTLDEAVSKRVTSDKIACDTLALQGTPTSNVEVSMHRKRLVSWNRRRCLTRSDMTFQQ